jgi:hypothetical protein
MWCGPDKEVVIVSRDTSSGTYEVWDEKVLKKERVTPRALLQASNGAVAQAVSKNPNAIGYVGFGYLNPSLKPLTVEGVEGNPSERQERTSILSPAHCTCSRQAGPRAMWRASSSSSWTPRRVRSWFWKPGLSALY